MATILIVDDCSANRQFLTTLLGYGGHRLLEAADGAEALEEVRSGHPDLVISDVLMPRRDGFEFVQRMRSDPAIAHTPVIFYTAKYDNQRDKDLAQQCGVSLVLTKPADPEIILHAVASALSAAPATDYAPCQEFEHAHLGLLTDKLANEADRLEHETIERRRAEAAVAERMRLMALSSEVGKSLTEGEGLAAMLDRCAEAFIRHLDAAFVRIWTLNPAEDVLELQASAALDRASDGPDRRIPAGQLGIGMIARDRRPYLTNALADDPLVLDRAWTEREGLVAFAGYPLLVSDRVVGVVALFARRPLSENALQAIASAASGIALAIEREAMGEALRQSEERFRQMAENIGEVVWMSDPETKQVLYINPAYERIWGRTCESLYDQPLSWTEAIHPDDRGHVLSALDRENHQGEYNVEYRIERPDEPVRWIWDRGFPIRDAAGQISGIVGVAQEITERVAAEEALREAEARMRAVMDHVVDGIVTIDERGLIESFNPAAQRIFGYEAAEVVGRNVTLLMPEPIRSEHDGVLANYLRSGRTMIMGTGREVEGRRRDGSTFPMDLAISEFQLNGRRVFTGIVRDITERKRAEERLVHQATHDPLTELPNRALLIERLGRIIDSSRTPDAPFALMLLDLDRFKEINDTFGHQYGDAVLRALRPRLVGAVRGSDTVARLGGDEFGILLPGADLARSTLVAERILAGLKQPIVVEGQTLDIGVSIGIALFPDHGRDADMLLRRADIAMYAAKRGRTGHASYSSDQADYTPRRLALIGELRQGIEDDQLILHYQPKVDLRTMRVGSVEALVRWMHPQEGMISPGEFIPLAEHTGLIKPLGLWSLRAAMLQSRAWDEAGLNLNIAVNLSPDNLLDGQLIDALIAMLEGADVSSRRLTVEVTESAMMTDPGRTRTVLARLHELGVRISIDDFGTGYSSLAYLKRLPVDEVKIDMCFIKDIMESERDACIVRSVIDLGHNLGMEVVAEGVEDRATLTRLVSWGCDFAQGYYFSRPLPPRELLSWVNDANASHVSAPQIGAAPRAASVPRSAREAPRFLTSAPQGTMALQRA